MPDISDHIAALPTDEKKVDVLRFINNLNGDVTLKQISDVVGEIIDERRDQTPAANASFIAETMVSLAKDGLVNIERISDADTPTYHVQLTPLATRALDFLSDVASSASSVVSGVSSAASRKG